MKKRRMKYEVKFYYTFLKKNNFTMVVHGKSIYDLVLDCLMEKYNIKKDPNLSIKGMILKNISILEKEVLNQEPPSKVNLKIQCITKKEKSQYVKSKEFLQSKEWKMLRYKAFELYGNKCQCCGASRETGEVMNVDHIKPRSKFPELALDINNLQILCSSCNFGKYNFNSKDWR